MTRPGGCACGAVRFTVAGEPWRVGLCHCMTCRKVHAAPFHAFAVFPVDAVVLTGPTQGWHSSPGMERVFCPVCGSHVLSREGDEVDLPLGSFDTPGVFAPTYESWVGRREAWLPPVAPRQHAGNREGSGCLE